MTSFIDAQEPAGCWPVYRADRTIARDRPAERIWGSVYSTAWGILALRAIQASPRPAVGDPVDASRLLAHSWLTRHLTKNAVNQSDNPDEGHEAPPSVGLQGLAIHAVLNGGDAGVVAEELRRSIARPWVALVTRDVPQADDGTMSGRWLCVWEGDYRMDVVRSYHLPWGIIATLDLYPMLTRVERARIHRWLEAAIEANATIGTKYSDQPWITSEYLIALKYLANGRSPTSARVPASSP